LRKPFYAVAALAVLLLAGCTEAALPAETVAPFKDDPHITILSPTAGQTIDGGDVTVRLSAGPKFKILPAAEATVAHLYGEGHYHLFLDVTPTPAGAPVPKGVTGIYHVTTNDFVISGVGSGHHVLWVELGFSDHIPYQGTLTKVEFDVINGSTGTPQVNPSALPSPEPSAAPSAAPSAPAGPITAKINLNPDPTNGGAFSPASASVKVGESVQWTWVDTTAQHTSTADDGTWDSGLAGAGNTFVFTFTKAGTYSYHCSVHPAMVGKITVS